MEEGFDMIGAETLIELRKHNKEVKVIAVVPYKNQEKNGNQNNKSVITKY